MTGVKDTVLFSAIHDFFMVFLPVQQRCSPNTIRSYRYAIGALLDFVIKTRSTPLSKITFDMLDSNHDGRISREEATALPQLAAAFKLLDTNHDGFITMDEVKSFALLHQAEITRRRQARSD